VQRAVRVASRSAATDLAREGRERLLRREAVVHRRRVVVRHLQASGSAWPGYSRLRQCGALEVVGSVAVG
jgi:hypothetical protein